MLRISVYSSKQLQAVIISTRNMDKEIRAQIRQHTRQMIRPEWERAMREHASTRLEHRVLAQTARVLVSDQNVTLRAAHIGKSLSGGLKASEHWHAVEMGSSREHTRSYQSHRGGTEFQIKNRHTTQQLRPRNKKGYVFFPAASNIIPRLAALWAQTAARTIHESFESR